MQRLLQCEMKLRRTRVPPAGTLERSDGKIEQAAGADAVDVGVSPGARFARSGGLIDNPILANNQCTLRTTESGSHLPQRTDLHVCQHRNESLIEGAREQRIKLVRGALRQLIEDIFAVAAELPFASFVCQDAQF